jgi:hypothetical protein
MIPKPERYQLAGALFFSVCTSVTCTPYNAISDDNADDQVKEKSRCPKRGVGDGEEVTSEEIMKVKEEGAAASVMSHWNVEEVGMTLGVYMNTARENLQTPGNVQGVC